MIQEDLCHRNLCNYYSVIKIHSTEKSTKCKTSITCKISKINHHHPYLEYQLQFEPCAKGTSLKVPTPKKRAFPTTTPSPLVSIMTSLSLSTCLYYIHFCYPPFPSVCKCFIDGPNLRQLQISSFRIDQKLPRNESFTHNFKASKWLNVGFL